LLKEYHRKQRNGKMSFVELLAPAGNLSCALAAYDAGADAVYAGLKNFNARERTENFTVQEMSKLLAYAHRNGKKVYLTFNTLIKESEIAEAAETLAELDSLRPDSLIVQDLGAVRMIREYFPNLTIHASTQMGLHNSAGLALAKELGASRVILERQTTLAELKKMMDSNPPVEVEVFIHGALCCCISGTCLLSSWMGGWSGNRGRCKQPCRRRYHSADGSGFFLSAQDLCTIDVLPELMQSGVSSLKIEGRLRRSDYVFNVVTAYRMAMDAAGNPEQFQDALPRAKEVLTKTCGRKWSLGYYTGESQRSLIKHDAMGVSGQLCAKVTEQRKTGFMISAMRRLHVGDMIRVQPSTGDEGPAICITKMSVNGQPVKRVLKGETCFIHSDKPVPDDSFVYKIGEGAADYTKRIESMPEQNPIADMDIFLNRSEMRIRVSGKTWRRELSLDAASNHPLQPENIRKEFIFPPQEPFTSGEITVQVEDNPFLPASVLKSLRNEFRVCLPEMVNPDSVREKSMERLERLKRDYAKLRHECTPNLPDTALIPRGKHPAIPLKKDCVIARETVSRPSPHEELVLPFFVNESSLKQVRQDIQEFYERGGRVFRITSLHHFQLLRGLLQIRVKTCMPLPVCNSMAVQELKRLGTELIQAWIELEKKELELLTDHSLLPVEIYRFGRPALLSTRANIPARNRMTDSRGNAFLIRQNGLLTQIYSDKVMSVPQVAHADACFYDYREADGSEKDTSAFNFEFTLP